MANCGHDHSHDFKLDKKLEWIDQIGIWLSLVCLVHCALTPALLLLLPALYWGGDYTHMALAVLLPILALLAFIPGFRMHKDWVILVMGLVGLALIVSALWAKSAGLEIGLTVNGSLLLIGAHWRNRILKNRLGKSPRIQAYGESL